MPAAIRAFSTNKIAVCCRSLLALPRSDRSVRPMPAYPAPTGRDMLALSTSDRMPLPLERRLTLDVSARVARMVGRASNKEGES